MSPEIQFAAALSREITKTVRPALGIKEQDVPISQISRDFNYALDVKAENVVRKAFAAAWRKGLMYGYVTEDQGLVNPPHDPELIFLIDPVDGSRPAMIDAEMATVTMAVVRGENEPTFANIELGLTYAIKENKMFMAEKGKGVFEISSNNRMIPVTQRENIPSDLRNTSLVFESASVSLELVGKVLDPLLEEVHFYTVYPSGSYGALSLVRGQNELHVDIRTKLLQDFSHLPVATKPIPKPLYTMDIAGPYLMIKELGGVITDADGQPLDNIRLWRFNNDGSWSEDCQISWVAAMSALLHQQALEKLREGFARLS